MTQEGKTDAIRRWVNDPTNEQAVRDALAFCDGDGHSIVAPEAFPMLAGSGLVEMLTRTIHSDGTPKGTIIGPDGTIRDHVDGITTLSMQETIADMLGVPRPPLSGRGFRARAARDAAVAYLDRRQVDELVGADDPMAEPSSVRVEIERAEPLTLVVDASRDQEPLDEARTMDLTPSPREYRRLLRLVINESPVADDVAWATRELDRVRGVESWAQIGDRP